MAKEVRQVLFEFLGDAGDLAADSDKAARSMGKADKAAGRTSSTLMTKLKPAAAAAGAAAAAMAAKWALDGIKMAESAEIIATSFDKTFGPATQALTDDLEDQRIALGLSEAEFQKLATQIGAVNVGMGQTEEEAAAVTAQMIGIAGDVAAFNGELGTAPQVIDDMNSALVGNYETLDKYGINLTAAAVEQQALADTGKAAASELTELEKRTAALALIEEQSALMTGSLAEQMDSGATKANEFAARMKDVQTDVGAALVPLKELLLEVLLALIPVLEALNPLIAAVGQAIGGLVKFVTPVIQVVGKLISVLVEGMVKIGQFMDRLNPLSNIRMPSFHSGGVVPGPTGTSQMAMLQGGERVIPAGAGSGMGGGGGGGTVINVSVNAGISSPQDTARAVVDMLEDYTATNGPVNIRTN